MPLDLPAAVAKALPCNPSCATGQLVWETREHDSACLARLRPLVLALVEQAVREERERCAKIADACEYPHPQDMKDSGGRGRFYQQNILSAWRQAGNRIAAAIRGDTGE